MRTITTSDAARDCHKLAGDATREPVRVLVEGKPNLVVVSEGEFQRLKGVAWDRLFTSMDRLACEAEASGLDEARLEELLADES